MYCLESTVCNMSLNKVIRRGPVISCETADTCIHTTSIVSYTTDILAPPTLRWGRVVVGV